MELLLLVIAVAGFATWLLRSERKDANARLGERIDKAIRTARSHAGKARARRRMMVRRNGGQIINRLARTASWTSVVAWLGARHLRVDDWWAGDLAFVWSGWPRFLLGAVAVFAVWVFADALVKRIGTACLGLVDALYARIGADLDAVVASDPDDPDGEGDRSPVRRR